MKGLDLSKFKKVHEDEKTTTLKHPDGHSIVIAVGELTPKLKNELKKLPTEPGMKNVLDKLPPEPGYTEPKKMASGGKVKMLADAGDPASAPSADQIDFNQVQEQDTPDSTPDSSGMSQDQFAQAMGPQPTTSQPAQDMDPNSPAPVQDDDSSDNSDEGSQPEQAPVPQPAPVPAPAPMTPQQKTAADSAKYQTDAALFGNDLAQGHITPQTYQSMFANKDTLGKIGTIFGMIVGGMGAGLSHQPNALMEIMQKQIDNDLNAQKQSASNQQNFIALNMQHEMNQASIAKQQADTLYQQALTSKIPEERQLLMAQAQQASEAGNKTHQEMVLDANTNAHNQALQSAFHSLVTSPAAQTPQGQQAIAMMWPQVKDLIKNNSDAAAGMKNYLNLVGGMSGSQNDPEQGFQQKITGMRMSGNPETIKMADDVVSRHLPGVPGLASAPLTDSDKNRVVSSQGLMASLQRFQDFTNKNANSVDPRVIAQGRSMASQLSSDYRSAIDGGVFKPSEQSFINEIVPSDPTKFVPSLTVTPKIQALMNETANRTNVFLKQKGFPVNDQPQPMNSQSSQGISEGNVSTDPKTGRPVVYKNGRWVFKK